MNRIISVFIILTTICFSLHGNTCLNFNGVDDLVSVPYSAELNSEIFTISLWAKVEGRGGRTRCPIALSETFKGFTIYVTEENTWEYTIGTGKGLTGYGKTNEIVTLNAWTHLAATYDGSNLKFYINGDLKSTIKSAYVPNGKSQLRIGCGVNDSNVPSYNFKGNIDELRIWNKARTASEILNDMNHQLLGTEDGLVAYFSFDENQGTITSDHKGNHIGTLSGCTWIESDILEEFTEIDSGLPARFSSAEWGDYDNDNDLDLVIVSEKRIKLYQNNSGTFVEVQSSFSDAFYLPIAKWVDHDNDGDLDILVVDDPTNGQENSRIYENNSNAFVETTFFNGFKGANFDLADYDNDGDVDILVPGNPIAFYINNDGKLEKKVINSGYGINADVSWVDYDNDGDHDIFITGVSTDSSPTSFMYTNDNGVFTSVETNILNLFRGDVEWGDYDNDGDLDLLISGSDSGSSYKTRIYRNDEGVFIDIGLLLNYGFDAKSSWLDYDNDGDLDFIISAFKQWSVEDPSMTIHKAFKNNQGVFSEVDLNTYLFYNSDIKPADYDNDGDLDFIAYYSSHDHKFYQNNSGIPNGKPAAPQNLTTAINNDYITFSWDEASLGEGLSYNIAIGNGTDPIAFKVTNSNLNGGERKVFDLGNCSYNNFYKLNIPLHPQSKFNWKVQALDNSYKASEFSIEDEFTLRDINLSNDQVLTKDGLLNWETVAYSRIKQYQIQISNSELFDNIIIDSLIENSFSELNSSVQKSSIMFAIKLSDFSESENLKNETYYWRIKPIYFDSRINSLFSQIPSSFTFNNGENITYAISGSIEFDGSYLRGYYIGGIYNETEDQYLVTVDKGSSITLTPKRIDYVFSPSDTTLTNITEDITDINFIATMIPTSVENIDLSMSAKLVQNYPNPFYTVTTIHYYLHEGAESVQLSVYNISGQLLKTLVNEKQIAGTYSVKFDRSGLNPGIYYYRLNTPSISVSKKMVIVN